MRKTVYITTTAGLIVFIALIAHEGVVKIMAVLSVGGWRLLWVAAFRAVPIALDTAGWFALIPRKYQLSKFSLFQARWIAESFNTLLPVAQVGGHVVRARLIARHGLTKTEAAATVMVDFTLGTATQFIFILIGAVLLFQQEKGGGEIMELMTGIIIAFFLLLAFFLIQRIGFFSRTVGVIQRMMRGRQLISMADKAKALDHNIGMIYRKHHNLLVCGSLRLLAWVTKSGEILLALYFLGFSVTLKEAFIIESLSTAVGSAAFMVPGALGVREGGIILIGSLIGLTPETALSLALIKRGREVIVGIPGLISWLIAQGRDLYETSNSGSTGDGPVE